MSIRLSLLYSNPFLNNHENHYRLLIRKRLNRISLQVSTILGAHTTRAIPEKVTDIG